MTLPKDKHCDLNDSQGPPLELFNEEICQYDGPLKLVALQTPVLAQIVRLAEPAYARIPVKDIEEKYFPLFHVVLKDRHGKQTRLLSLEQDVLDPMRILSNGAMPPRRMDLWLMLPDPEDPLCFTDPDNCQYILLNIELQAKKVEDQIERATAYVCSMYSSQDGNSGQRWRLHHINSCWIHLGKDHTPEGHRIKRTDLCEWFDDDPSIRPAEKSKLRMTNVYLGNIPAAGNEV